MAAPLPDVHKSRPERVSHLELPDDLQPCTELESGAAGPVTPQVGWGLQEPSPGSSGLPPLSSQDPDTLAVMPEKHLYNSLAFA